MKGYKTQQKTTSERFYEKVKITIVDNDCWLWLGAKNNKGYGQFRVNGKMELAHRVSWTLNSGKIPRGLNVLHKCDVCACVNPNHLFLGSQKDNIKDCVKKKRNHVNWPEHKGEKHGMSKLTEKDVKEIREKRKNGEKGTKLAKEYKVSRTTIVDIVYGKLWKHI